MKKNYLLYNIIMGSMLALSACTDLEVVEKDSLVIETESGEFGGVNPEAALNAAYADIIGFGNQEDLYALLEVTSDELLVPTRGTDWGDNGVWRKLHQHTWDASHPHILDTWNSLNSNVFRLNQLLAPESKASATQVAEGRFLRAYNMFLLLDLFGQIPFRDVNDGIDVNPQVFSAQEAFDFILEDLTEAIADLPVISPGNNTIRASSAAANFLLAKLYLNKHVFLSNPEPNPADMTKVVEHVDAIAADGFSLEDDYFNLFKETPDTETIFWTNAEVGNRIWNTLHYHQTLDNPGGGWNGFTTTADFYALFEGDPDNNAPGSGQEERRGLVPEDSLGIGFLVGQQYGPEGPLTDRSGNPLIFTKELPGLIGNNERTGIRVLKYHPGNGGFTKHLVLFRYADAHLMKIEAILRGGTSADNALELYNELRMLREASPAASITLDDILDERGRELYIEGWRRNDQIRFGTFTATWAMKDNTEAFRVLFPIPANAVATNPNLEQNPGY